MSQLFDILSTTAEKHPDNIALSDASGLEITYGQLFEKAVSTKYELNALGICQGYRIGILSSKNIGAVSAILSVLSCSAVYVPLDADAPSFRNLVILNNCNVNFLILEDLLWSEYQDDFSETHHSVELSSLEGMLLLIRNEKVSLSCFQPDDLAIILNTSGSTGVPKGVMITNKNAFSFIEWANVILELSQQDVFASIAPFHFDLSVFDLYVAFLNGAHVHLMNAATTMNPRMLSTLIDEKKITVWYSTPSLLKLMINYGKLERFDHKSLRYILFAGEIFSIEALKQIKKAWPQADYYNLYGPTETNVVTYYKVPENIENEIAPCPIGKPCSFAELKIIDPRSTEHTIDEGELWVSGQSVCHGYSSQDSRPEKSFHQDTNGKLWYKTGDWVSLDKNGEYHFKGRKDRMVKRNGYRIEMAEIEAALQQHPEILTAAVVTRNSQDSIEICAYYQIKNSDCNFIDLIQLKTHCLKFIPKYMMPDTFTAVPEMPQTSSHKIDYQRLSNL